MAGGTFAGAAKRFAANALAHIKGSSRAPHGEGGFSKIPREASYQDGTRNRARRGPSPSHRPQTGVEDEDVYVLTLLTDQAHHERMTQLRTRYFPPHLNKLSAHLTLFHALPASRLDDAIVPRIEEVASKTARFPITAANLVRLRKRHGGGVAVALQHKKGGRRAREVSDMLRDTWKRQRFLSHQDHTSHGPPHYTLMNKVDDEAQVESALKELRTTFKQGGDTGVAEGLGLYRYEKGYWRWVRRFDFTAADPHDT